MLLLIILLTQSTIANKIDIMCCYYRQHYHNAYCNYPSESPGCVLGPALVAGAPRIICSSTSDCLPDMSHQGYWLEGFKRNCDECITYFS